MGLSTRLEKATNQTSTSSYVITWSSNEPTAAATQTIANGTVPTVAELGQSVANITAILNQLQADVTAMYVTLNAGE